MYCLFAGIQLSHILVFNTLSLRGNWRLQHLYLSPLLDFLNEEFVVSINAELLDQDGEDIYPSIMNTGDWLRSLPGTVSTVLMKK